MRFQIHGEQEIRVRTTSRALFRRSVRSLGPLFLRSSNIYRVDRVNRTENHASSTAIKLNGDLREENR